MNKAKKWEQHIEQWKRSKKSKASYCRENGINTNTFDYWQGKLASSLGENCFSSVILME
jgi:hypothetical protein